MSNILQFPGTKSSAPVAAPPRNVEEIPLPAQLQIMSISDTAAVQMVKALSFYADQGYDGGKKARLALLGAQTVVQSTIH